MLYLLDEEIRAIENEIMEQGEDIDKVLNINNIHNDYDMIMFALKFLLSNVYDALIEGRVE